MPFESIMDSVPRVDTDREPFTTANVPSGALFEFNSPPRFTESWLKIYVEVGTPLHYTSCDSPSDFIYDDDDSTTVSFTKFELYEGGYYKNQANMIAIPNYLQTREVQNRLYFSQSEIVNYKENVGYIFRATIQDSAGVTSYQ